MIYTLEIGKILHNRPKGMVLLFSKIYVLPVDENFVILYCNDIIQIIKIISSENEDLNMLEIDGGIFFQEGNDVSGRKVCVSIFDGEKNRFNHFGKCIDCEQSKIYYKVVDNILFTFACRYDNINFMTIISSNEWINEKIDNRRLIGQDQVYEIFGQLLRPFRQKNPYNSYVD